MMARQDTAGASLTKVGWYGKIPAAGDFVHRNVSREIIAWWDKWLQLSLSGHWAQADGMRRAYAQAPMWNFVIPRGSGPGVVQMGCIAASHDRVGRRYPVCAMLDVDAERYEPQLLEGGAGFFRQLGMALMGAVRNGYGADQLEQAVVAASQGLAPAQTAGHDAGGDIMSILSPQGTGLTPPDRLAWPDLPLCFNPHSHTSYWWTNQVDGAALRTYVHGGALTASLFSTLFVPAAGVRRDAWTPR